MTNLEEFVRTREKKNWHNNCLPTEQFANPRTLKENEGIKEDKIINGILLMAFFPLSELQKDL